MRAASALALALVGAITLLGQTALLRELTVTFYGSELIVLLGLGLWLLWTALGALLGRLGDRRADGPPVGTAGKLAPAGGGLAWLLAAWALALPAAAVFARGVRPLLAPVPGAYLDFPVQLAALALALLPAGLLAGLLFRAAARRAVAEGARLAGAYAVESAGGVLGGLAATLLLRAGTGNLAILLLGSIPASAAALAWRGERGRRTAAAALLAAGLAALAAAPALDRALTRWTHPDLVATRDTPYGRVTVERRLGQAVVFENDALAAATESPDAEAFVHPAALLHPAPRRVLVLGGLAEGLLGALLEHAPQRVDAVELDTMRLATVRPFLGEAVRRALDHPAVRLAAADPRRFLAAPGEPAATGEDDGGQAAPRGAGRGAPYDLILVGLPEPATGLSNRAYTREFFALCAARLADGGVLALRLPTDENLWTPLQAGRVASVAGALDAVFAHRLVLPGARTLLAASRRPLPGDPETLVRRWEARGAAGRLVGPAWLRWRFTDDRRRQAEARLAATRAPVNRDARPVCHSYTQLVWLSHFFPRLAALELDGLARVPGPADPRQLLWLAAAPLFLLGRRRAGARRALLAALAGLLGMVLENLLILDYQTRSGVLYQDLGLLLMAFMGGLALGAGAMERLAAGRGGPARAAGALALAAFAALSFALAWRFEAGGPAPLGFALAAVALAGALTAALFAYAGLRRLPDQAPLVSPLYAADVAGGCLGALAAGLALAPVLGLAGAAAGMGLLALAGLVLL